MSHHNQFVDEDNYEIEDLTNNKDDNAFYTDIEALRRSCMITNTNSTELNNITTAANNHTSPSSSFATVARDDWATTKSDSDDDDAFYAKIEALRRACIITNTNSTELNTTATTANNHTSNSSSSAAVAARNGRASTKPNFDDEDTFCAKIKALRHTCMITNKNSTATAAHNHTSHSSSSIAAAARDGRSTTKYDSDDDEASYAKIEALRRACMITNRNSTELNTTAIAANNHTSNSSSSAVAFAKDGRATTESDSDDDDTLCAKIKALRRACMITNTNSIELNTTATAAHNHTSHSSYSIAAAARDGRVTTESDSDDDEALCAKIEALRRTCMITNTNSTEVNTSATAANNHTSNSSSFAAAAARDGQATTGSDSDDDVALCAKIEALKRACMITNTNSTELNTTTTTTNNHISTFSSFVVNARDSRATTESESDDDNVLCSKIEALRCACMITNTNSIELNPTTIAAHNHTSHSSYSIAAAARDGWVTTESDFDDDEALCAKIEALKRACIITSTNSTELNTTTTATNNHTSNSSSFAAAVVRYCRATLESDSDDDDALFSKIEALRCASIITNTNSIELNTTVTAAHNHTSHSSHSVTAAVRDGRVTTESDSDDDEALCAKIEALRRACIITSTNSTELNTTTTATNNHTSNSSSFTAAVIKYCRATLESDSDDDDVLCAKIEALRRAYMITNTNSIELNTTTTAAHNHTSHSSYSVAAAVRDGRVTTESDSDDDEALWAKIEALRRACIITSTNSTELNTTTTATNNHTSNSSSFTAAVVRYCRATLDSDSDDDEVLCAKIEALRRAYMITNTNSIELNTTTTAAHNHTSHSSYSVAAAVRDGRVTTEFDSDDDDALWAKIEALRRACTVTNTNSTELKTTATAANNHTCHYSPSAAAAGSRDSWATTKSYFDFDDDDAFYANIEALRRAYMITNTNSTELNTTSTAANNHTSLFSFSAAAGGDGWTTTMSNYDEDDDDDEDDIELVQNIQNRFSLTADLCEPLSMKPLYTLPLEFSNDEDDFETLRAMQRLCSVYVCVYPKVKVREQDQDGKHATYEHKISSLLTLKDIQSLATYDSCFTVKEYQDVSPSPVIRIPKNYVPNAVMPMFSESEGAENNNKQIDDEDRPNIRASPIPRPRAVISSPDNDAVIGNKNRIKAERPSALKNHNSIPNEHAQCKVIKSHIAAESPMNNRKSKDAADKKNDLNGKKGTVTTSKKRNVRTGKPSSVRI